MTEQESRAALETALPRDMFVLHAETIDRGVDYSLEVVDDGLDKNYRAQIQLKGTNSLKPLLDGTYSLDGNTTNINALLNSPISLYFLYIKPANEIRYVWTLNERRRIETENKNWIKQETVKLRFVKVLNQTTREQIRQRIMAHGKGIRIINENVLLADSKYVVCEIDRDTFAVTDLEKLREIINTNGIGLCIVGKSEWVLEKIRLFSKEQRENSAMRIIEAVAYFEKADYQRSRECIAKLRSESPELSDKDRVLIAFVKLHCDAETGRLTYSELVEGLRLLSEEEIQGVPYNVRFTYLQKAIWTIDVEAQRYSGRNERKRREIFDELKREVLTNSNTESESTIDVRNQFSILKTEGELINMESRAELGSAVLRSIFGLSDLVAVIAKYSSQIEMWEGKVDLLLSKSPARQMIADIICQKVGLFFLGRTWNLILSKHTAFEPAIDIDVLDGLRPQLDYAIDVYSQLSLIPQKLKAQISLAGIHFVARRMEEFTKIQEEVVSVADDLNLLGIRDEALNPIYLQSQNLIDQVEDGDQRRASLDDHTIHNYSQQQIDAFSLPQERFENIKLAHEFMRFSAIEKLTWCESLNLVEDTRQNQHRATMYRANPNRSAICLRHGFQSNIERPDWEVVAAEFKRKYCDSCPDRRPKHYQ